MATYLCECGAPADWYLHQLDHVTEMDAYVIRPSTDGWRYAVCNQHVGQVIRDSAPQRCLLRRVP